MKKILCVDDSATIRLLVKKTLEPEGFEVLEASNGHEALHRCETEDITLFLVDVNMPVMDGFEFVKRLKETEKYKNSPVIFLTTESSTQKKEMGKKLGVNGWIVKPFDPASLVKVIKMLTQ